MFSLDELCISPLSMLLLHFISSECLLILLHLLKLKYELPKHTFRWFKRTGCWWRRLKLTLYHLGGEVVKFNRAVYEEDVFTAVTWSWSWVCICFNCIFLFSPSSVFSLRNSLWIFFCGSWNAGKTWSVLLQMKCDSSHTGVSVCCVSLCGRVMGGYLY